MHCSDEVRLIVECPKHEIIHTGLRCKSSFLLPCLTTDLVENKEKNQAESLHTIAQIFLPIQVCETSLAWAVDLINHRPRKRLNYRTPHEVFWELAGVALRTRI